jgi:hypothetical protein
MGLSSASVHSPHWRWQSVFCRGEAFVGEESKQSQPVHPVTAELLEIIEEALVTLRRDAMPERKRHADAAQSALARLRGLIERLEDLERRPALGRTGRGHDQAA